MSRICANKKNAEVAFFFSMGNRIKIFKNEKNLHEKPSFAKEGWENSPFFRYVIFYTAALFFIDFPLTIK